MSNLCNCGSPIRYSHKDGESCNKYVICPTYGDLRQELEVVTKIILMYENTLNLIKDKNAMDCEYRTWAINVLKKADEWR